MRAFTSELKVFSSITMANLICLCFRIKSFMAFQGKLNGRVTLHESRNDLQLVNLSVPTRSALVVSKSIVMLFDTIRSFEIIEKKIHVQLHSTALVNIPSSLLFALL